MTKACLQFYTGCAREESQPLYGNIYSAVALGALNTEHGGGFLQISTLREQLLFPTDRVLVWAHQEWGASLLWKKTQGDQDLQTLTLAKHGRGRGCWHSVQFAHHHSAQERFLLCFF